MFVVNHHVVRFDIPVHYPHTVAVIQGLQAQKRLGQHLDGRSESTEAALTFRISYM